MNKTNTEYKSPITEICEFSSEGVLCQSGGFTPPQWEYDNDEQDFGW